MATATHIFVRHRAYVISPLLLAAYVLCVASNAQTFCSRVIALSRFLWPVALALRLLWRVTMRDILAERCMTSANIDNISYAAPRVAHQPLVSTVVVNAVIPS